MVVIINVHTEPVNPPSASPVLTHAQMWGGALYELRNKAQFYPTVESSKVLSETDEEIVISSILTNHTTIGHVEGEHITKFALSPPYKWDGTDDQATTFHMIGIIGQGSGGDTDLYYTTIYEWNEKEVEKGSAKHKELEKDNYHPSGIAKDTIENARKMIRNGEL